MPIEFKLPSLGENVRTGDVVKVLVKEGDVIEANQGICELETDKAVVEISCPHAGRIVKVHFREGQTVEVGQTLLTIASEKEAGGEEPPEKPKEEPAAAGAAAGIAGTVPATESPSESSPRAAQPLYAQGEPIPAGPLARRVARQLGIDLRMVRGSGPGGRITPEDVEAAARLVPPIPAMISPGVPKPTPVTAGSTPVPTPEVSPATVARPAAPPKSISPAVTGESGPLPTPPPGEPGRDAWGPIRRERMSRIRLTIAEQMVRSVSNIPHVTNFDEADITELEQLRKQVPENFVGAGIKLTLMPFVMKAVAMALRNHPVINATLDMERQEIIYKEYVHLGVAVDTPRGLVVPVIRNADRMTIAELARALATLVERARTAQFGVEELRGGTFTISNLGAVGGRFSTPIINYPEVAILLLGRSRWQPVVRDGKIEPRFMMPLSLSYDHRLIDGATAQRFLNEVIDWLQSPGKLLLAG
jgi:pyruvate dehydrogenase E2 component (dihydrolipoamide acetyltransferase)